MKFTKIIVTNLLKNCKGKEDLTRESIQHIISQEIQTVIRNYPNDLFGILNLGFV